MGSELPDYVKDANAVMKDDFAQWRYGKAPDYAKTRQYWSDSKSTVSTKSVNCPSFQHETDRVIPPQPSG